MAFTGKYELENQENYDEFLKRIGIPNYIIEKARNIKFVTEVFQNGNEFTWSQMYPDTSLTNTFTIDEECEMHTIRGRAFKATVRMEDGKICVQFPNYYHTAEICKDTLVERSTVSGLVEARER